MSAPRLIMGAEQSRARTKQVACNQQLAGACDEPQRQSKLSLHAYTHIRMHEHAQLCPHNNTIRNTQKIFIYSRMRFCPVICWHASTTLDCLDLVLKAQRPQIWPYFLSTSISTFCSAWLPILCTTTGLFALLPLIPLSHSFVRLARGV